MAPTPNNQISRFELFQQMVQAVVSGNPYRNIVGAVTAIATARQVPALIVDNRSDYEMATLAVDIVAWKAGAGPMPVALTQIGFLG